MEGLCAGVGQRDLERRPAAAGEDAAANSYLAVMAVNDAFGERQAEAIAVVQLGGEEGLEDFFAEFFGDAGPVVGDNELDFIGTLAQAKIQGAVERQGVHGVDNEIGDDLEDLAAMNFGDDAFGQVFDEVNFLLVNAALVDANGGFSERDQVGHAGRGGRLREAERLLRDFAEEADLLVGQYQISADIGENVWFGEREIDQVADGLERIADFVHQLQGELAGGGALLGAANRLGSDDEPGFRHAQRFAAFVFEEFGFGDTAHKASPQVCAGETPLGVDYRGGKPLQTSNTFCSMHNIGRNVA